MRDERFRKRTLTLLSFLVVWAALVAAHLFYYTVGARERYLSIGNRLAWRQGTLPAARGRILDRDGIVLAWTERRFDLILNFIPEIPQRRRRMFSRIREIIPDVLPGGGENSLLKEDLTPLQCSALSRIAKSYPEIKVQRRFVRRYYENPEVKRVMGVVETHEDRLVGVRGLENVFEERLKGQDGVYKVMIDRHQRWVDGTFEWSQEPETNDVTLPVTVLQVEKGIVERVPE